MAVLVGGQHRALAAGAEHGVVFRTERIQLRLTFGGRGKEKNPRVAHHGQGFFHDVGGNGGQGSGRSRFLGGNMGERRARFGRSFEYGDAYAAHAQIPGRLCFRAVDDVRPGGDEIAQKVGKAQRASGLTAGTGFFRVGIAQHGEYACKGRGAPEFTGGVLFLAGGEESGHALIVHAQRGGLTAGRQGKTQVVHDAAVDTVAAGKAERGVNGDIAVVHHRETSSPSSEMRTFSAFR